MNLNLVVQGAGEAMRNYAASYSPSGAEVHLVCCISWSYPFVRCLLEMEKEWYLSGELKISNRSLTMAVAEKWFSLTWEI